MLEVISRVLILHMKSSFLSTEASFKCCVSQIVVVYSGCLPMLEVILCVLILHVEVILSEYSAGQRLLCSGAVLVWLSTGHLVS